MIIMRTTTHGITCWFEMREENGAAWYIDTEGHRYDGISGKILEVLCQVGLMSITDYNKIVSFLTGG